MIEVLLRMVQSKAVAVFVGPAGIGLLGVLTSVTGLVSTVFSLGTSSSSVREIAAAAGSGDHVRVSRVVFTVRRTSLVLGVLGTAALLAFARPIAQLVVGSGQFTWYLIALAPLVLFQVVGGGQLALLRGLRQIETLARITIFSTLLGVLTAVPLVWVWGAAGIPAALSINATVGLLASWWYARRVESRCPSLNLAETWREARALLGLGVAFLLSGLQISGLQVALRTLLLQATDLSTVGQFLASTAVSHVYVDIVLLAMSWDYVPRLSQHNGDNSTSNRLVNEQTEIVLLLVGPGLVALVVFAPVLIPLLYSGRFGPAIEVFRWQCLGVLLRAASWPLGYVFVARGLRGAFLVTETARNAFYLLIFFFMTRSFGLVGAAMSFALMYPLYFILIYFLVRRETGFFWAAPTRQVAWVVLGALTASLALGAWLLRPWQAVFGLVLLGAASGWAYRELCRRAELSLVSAVLFKVSSVGRRLGILKARAS